MLKEALKQSCASENDSEHMQRRCGIINNVVYNRYVALKGSCLSDLTKCKVADGTYVSMIEDMTLEEFIDIRQLYCENNHAKPCSECRNLVAAAKEILKSLVVDLKTLFLEHFTIVSYKTDKAVRRIMQLPVVVIRVCLEGPGSQRLYVTPKMRGVNYSLFPSLIEKCVLSHEKQVTSLTKDMLNGLCHLASTEKDRTLIKYAACRSRGLSINQSQKVYGVSNFRKLSERVECSLQQAEMIRNEVRSLALIEEKAILQSFGINLDDSNSSSDSSSDSESGEPVELDWQSDDEASTDEEQESEKSGDSGVCEARLISDGMGNSFPDSDRLGSVTDSSCDSCILTERNISQNVRAAPSHEQLLYILRENKLNWFLLVEELKLLLRNHTKEVLQQTLLDFVYYLSNSDLSIEEEQQVEHSRQAFLELERQKMVDEIDDSVRTDSESDNPEEWVDVLDALSVEGKALIEKQRKIMKRKVARRVAKETTMSCLLKRRLPRKVSSIITRFPNIGKDMEDYVKERRVGADQWRRTGVLTFSAVKLKGGPKVTYKRLQKHLEDKYKTKISYGTIVQLCVARNKRRISARRYHGVAKVTCRRARKGFAVKLNPDAHYCTSMYKNLDYVQLQDGRDKVTLNRDDQAGFRLDTTYTHKGHRSISMQGQQEVTCHTDYVNKYTSILQTTSYMFQKTETTSEKCLGVVKAHEVFPKNPSQHAEDFKMVEKLEEMKPWIANKPIDCIRVDGASDEGPAHLEVQFLWTELHIQRRKVCTVVTTRQSGGSYMNKVELMNGCLAVAHSNLYIPSTLGGSNFTAQGLDSSKLAENLDLATDVYIDRVNGAPCGDCTISLVKGAKNDDETSLNSRRPDLLCFLNGKKRDRAQLQKSKPALFKYFESVWDVRHHHMVKGLLNHYVFMLDTSLCCNKDCPHPLCKSGESKMSPVPLWFKDGPPVSLFPLPVRDLDRPWGGTCEECDGVCSGHYLKPQQALERISEEGLSVCDVLPPSVILKQEFNRISKVAGSKVSEEEITCLAKKTMLSAEEVRMWFDHLALVQERRKIGARKAAETRRKKG